MKRISLGVVGVALAMTGTTAMVAEGCAVPRVTGGTILYLNVTGISCADGSRLVTETLKASYGRFPVGYVCKTSVSGRNTTYDCNGAAGKHYDFRYAVN